MKKHIFLYIISLFLCTPVQSKSISRHGINFIKTTEKYSLKRYWDNGAYSIGYGHRMPKGTKQYIVITKQMAERLLKEDLKEAEKTANSIIDDLKWDCTQSFYDGLVSVIYNCGSGGIYKTVFYKRLKACRSKNRKVNVNDYHYTLAAIKTARIPDGKYRDGVKKRRLNEYKMMKG